MTETSDVLVTPESMQAISALQQNVAAYREVQRLIETELILLHPKKDPTRINKQAAIRLKGHFAFLRKLMIHWPRSLAYARRNLRCAKPRHGFKQGERERILSLGGCAAQSMQQKQDRLNNAI